MVSVHTWLQYMQMNPWHSWQLANATIPVSSKCNALVYEYAWQDADRAGRAEIAKSIQRAEDLYAQYANYYPRKRFNTVTIPWPKLGDYRLTRYVSSTPDGHWLGLQLPDGYIHELGYEHKQHTKTINLTYLDLDGDGLYETAQATCQLPADCEDDEMYFEFLSTDYVYPESNRRIIPRTITRQGANATITFDSPQLVKPILLTIAKPQTLDPSVIPPTAGSPFAAQIQASRVWCDPSGTTLDTAQMVLIWETLPYPPYATAFPFSTNVTQDPSALAYAIARGSVRNSHAGIIYAGESVYNANTDTWSGRTDFSEYRPPDRVIVRYQSGVTDRNLDLVIARLAAAELSRPVCACTSANKELSEWQTDLSRIGAQQELYAQPGDMTNPFGSRRGHVYAWRTVQQAQRLQGILA